MDDRTRQVGWPVPAGADRGVLVALSVSMAGLGYAMRDIPTGTAYVVWVGIGGVATVAYAMLVGDEPVSAAKVALVLGIVGCVANLRPSTEGPGEQLGQDRVDR